MTISNVSSATSGAITQASGNPGELQRSNALSSTRITQNSPESLRAPFAGNVLFRVLEETRAGSRVRPVFNIFESGNEAGEKSYQITMSDDLRDSITMKLEVPKGENLESVQEKLKGGGYQVKITEGGSEGKPVCQLRENIGLKGGMPPLREEVQVRKTVGVKSKQLELWIEEGRLSTDQAKPKSHPRFGNDHAKIAKEIRRDIVNKILELNIPTANKVFTQNKITLNGVDLPTALQEIADAITDFEPKVLHGRLILTLNSESPDGFTLVHIAAGKGQANAILALKALGADMNKPNNSSYTPSHIAAVHGQADAILALAEAGANMNQLSKSGNTPAHAAARANQAGAILALKKVGAYMHIRNNASQTPLHIAEINGNTEIVHILSSLDANPNIQNSDAPASTTSELKIDKMSWGPVKREADLYAASHPPHTSRGREAFYNLLRDKNITCIVDLRSADSVQDQNRYYPETAQASMTFGDLSVTAKSTDSSSPGIQVTNLEINRDSGGSNANEQPHQVSIYHFLNWKELSTINPESLNQLGKILISHAESKANALVHCKAGIGRTGTLVTYAQIKQMLETLASDKGEISREQIIQAVTEQININRKRRGCVETREQFELIVETLARDADEIRQQANKSDLDIDKMSWEPAKREAGLYAASHPPHTSRGREAFYNLLRDKNITCIVDLRSADSVQDQNRYYPETEQASMTFGDLNVTAKSTDSSSPGIQVTNLEINRDSGGSNANEQPHQVSIYHFLNWKELSTINPESLNQLGKILISHAESKANALVHCKAGIGRTGTLVTYAQIKQMLETLASAKGEISREQIIQAVTKQIDINRKRRGCVETREQFDLIVDTLARDADMIRQQANFSSSSTSPPTQPGQPKIELTPEQQIQLIALLGHAKAIELLGDAIDIDETKKNGGPKVLNQSEYKEIKNTCEEVFEEVETLKQNQDELCLEFKKIMGDHPKDLTEPQQKYFHAFLGAMQHFFIVSNALSSKKFQIDIKAENMLGAAAEQIAEVVAAGLPGAGFAFKGAALLISQLLENRLINHLSPFAQLFKTPNQCAAVAYELADQLTQIKKADIQNTPDAPTRAPTLAQRCEEVFKKRLKQLHLSTGEPNKIDELAMKDVQKLVECIYSFQKGKSPVTVNGAAYGYKDLQNAIGSKDSRPLVIAPLLKLMGENVPVQTDTLSTSQNDRQHQNRDRDAAGPSTQLTQEMFERLRELDSKFAGIDAEKLQQLLNQQRQAPSSHDRLVAGRGDGLLHASALSEEHLRDPAHSSGVSAALHKEFLEYQKLVNLLATRVVLLEESTGSTSPSLQRAKRISGASDEGSSSGSVHFDKTLAASNAVFEEIRNQNNARRDGAPSVASSGIKTEDELQDSDSILMQEIKSNASPERFASMLKKYPENLNHVVVNKKGEYSSVLDMAAHYGRPELVTLLIKAKARSAQNKRVSELDKIAEHNKDKYDDQGHRIQSDEPAQQVRRRDKLKGWLTGK